MLAGIFSIYLALTVLLCFFRIRIGIAMFLGYSVLVPFLKFFSLGQNSFPFFIILALLFNYGYKTLYYKPLIPFLFLYAAQFLIIPFQSDMPIGAQINAFRVDVMNTLLLPFAMINVMKRDKSTVFLFVRTLVISVVVAAFYSMLLTIVPGTNPYLLAVLPLSGGEFNEAYALAENEGRVFGRISGVFTHPMTNGLFLSFSVIFVLSFIFDLKSVLKKYFSIILILVLFLATFFIGVRTSIAAAALGVGVYVLLERKFKIALFIFLGGISISFVLLQIPEMTGFVSSIFDSKSSSVSGSSLDMRISQLNGALHEIKSNYLFGKGYGWTNYYKDLRGDHPVLLAFESLVYVVLCNSGFVGVGIWLIMMLLYIMEVRQSFKRTYFHIMLSLISVYMVYSTITGEYGYMKIFLIFYSIMWMYGKTQYSNIFIARKRSIYEHKSKSNRPLSTSISPNT